MSNWSWNDCTTMTRGKDMGAMPSEDTVIEMVCASCWILTSLMRYSSEGYSIEFSMTLQQWSSCVVLMSTSVFLLVVKMLIS